MVFSGLSTAWRLANWPTRRSPVLANPTTEGVKRLPSLLVITVGFPPSITATTEFVVPRSIPTAFAILKTSKNDFVQAKHPQVMRLAAEARPMIVPNVELERPEQSTTHQGQSRRFLAP